MHKERRQHIFRTVVLLLFLLQGISHSMGGNQKHSDGGKKTERQTNKTQSNVQKGRALFHKSGCSSCHSTRGVTGVGPAVNGIAGTKVRLQNRQWILRDATYFKTKIRFPNRQITFGSMPVMPPYRNTFTEAQLNALVAYLFSLRKAPASRPATRPARAR